MRLTKLRGVVILCAVGVLAIGCSEDGDDGADTGGGADVGAMDTGAGDTGGMDAGSTDPGEMSDPGATDPGMADPGMADPGMADMGGGDTGMADAGGSDTGMADAGGSDTGMADAGGSDTGMADAGGLTAEEQRGQYIVEVLAACSDCHTPRTAEGAPDMANYLAGVECFIDVDPGDEAVGCIHTRNLTNHPTGLANRTDQEIKDMFLKGERPDGTFLHPIMPYYVMGNMSAEDADAVVAFLRTVPGVDHTVPDKQAPFDNVPAASPVVDIETIPKPDPGYADVDAANRGRYIAANIGVCLECHSPDADMAGGAPHPVDLTKPFQGGRAFPLTMFGPSPPPLVDPSTGEAIATVYSSNITPHATTGVGAYTVEQLVAALKQGVDHTSAPLCPPMPSGPMGPYAHLTDADAQDIAHYLLSIAPVDNAVPNGCGFPPPQP